MFNQIKTIVLTKNKSFITSRNGSITVLTKNLYNLDKATAKQLIDNIPELKDSTYDLTENTYSQIISEILNISTEGNISFFDFPEFIEFAGKETQERSTVCSLFISISESTVFFVKCTNVYELATRIINQGSYDPVALQILSGKAKVIRNKLHYSELEGSKRLAKFIEQAHKINLQNKEKEEAYVLTIDSKNQLSVQKFTFPFIYNSRTNNAAFPDELLLNEQTKSEVDWSVNQFGVITNLVEVSPINSKFTSLKMYRTGIIVPDISQIDVIRSSNAGAVDASRDLAITKAFVEGVERFASGKINRQLIQNEDTQKLIPNSEKILGYDPSQENSSSGIFTPNITKSSDKFYPCVGVRRMIFKQNIINIENKDFLPYDLIYYPIKKQRQMRFAFSNSSGCAGHTNLSTAVVKALLELLERDSVMLMWLNKLSLPIIDKETLPHNIQNRIKTFESNLNREIILLYANLDKRLPHIIAITINNRKEYPYFHMGSSASFDINESIEKSLEEIEGPFYFSRSIYNKIAIVDPKNVSTVRDHFNFYHNPDNFKHIEFMIRGAKVNYNLLKASISEISTDLNKIGGEYYLANLSDSFAHSKNLFVVRALSTELVPIWFGNKSIPLGKERISKIGKQFNHFKLDTKVHDYPFLHPMG